MTLMEEIRQTEKELAGGEYHLDPAIVSALIIARSIAASAARVAKAINGGLFDVSTSIDTQGGK